MKPVSLGVKDMIVALLNHTAAACHHAGLTAKWLSSLTKICMPEQMMLIMKYSIQSMVQLAVALGFLDPPAKPNRLMNLPDDPVKWMRLTLLLNPDANLQKLEPLLLTSQCHVLLCAVWGQLSTGRGHGKVQVMPKDSSVMCY